MPESAFPKSPSRPSNQELVFGAMQENLQNGSKESYFNAQGSMNYGRPLVLFLNLYASFKDKQTDTFNNNNEVTSGTTSTTNSTSNCSSFRQPNYIAEFDADKNHVVSKPLLNSSQNDRLHGANNLTDSIHHQERETWAGEFFSWDCEIIFFGF